MAWRFAERNSEGNAFPAILFYPKRSFQAGGAPGKGSAVAL
jgi:hypothetical protein